MSRRKTMDFKPSKCIRCLAEVALETFLRNDHVCDTCAEASPAEEYRYRSNDDQQAAAIAAMGEA